MEFCHSQEEGTVLKAELHIKTRRWRRPGLLNALLEVEEMEESRVVALPLKSRHRGGWKKFDISAVIIEAGQADWRIHLKFQEEFEDGKTSDVRLLKPRTVLKLSEKPFIVIFYENTEDNEVKRRKRSITTEDQRNFYAHNELNEIETEIVTMDRKYKNKTDNRDEIDDIDDEDELILDYESDDLSEAEAVEHRFRVSDKQQLIPLPRWRTDRTRSRKRNHHKRFFYKSRCKLQSVTQSITFRRLSGRWGRGRGRGRRMRNGQEEEDEEQERSHRERWNSLPRIWRSLGREVRERERERERDGELHLML